LVFQIIVNDRHYSDIAPGSTLKDSTHYMGYVGTSWDATGKLQGNAKVGMQHKDFESSSREDFDSFSFIYCPKELHDILESALICELKPLLNITTPKKVIFQKGGKI
jgi:hypothetical protein